MDLIKNVTIYGHKPPVLQVHFERAGTYRIIEDRFCKKVLENSLDKLHAVSLPPCGLPARGRPHPGGVGGDAGFRYPTRGYQKRPADANKDIASQELFYL